ncbi:hypothetical protein K458DRAFT_286529, partial [Lentithecium fluviatile CBS 122367]
RCDGARPTCSECASRSTECRYSETEARQIRKKFQRLRDRRTAHGELVDLLQTLPESDAFEILRRIRAGENAEGIVRHVQEGNLLMELSVVPETRLRYQFPYIANMPSALLTPENKYLSSLLYEAIQAGSPSNEAAPAQSLLEQSPYAKPIHAARMIDPLLEQAKASEWTSVSTNDRLMRRLLEEYFVNEHPWELVIHKDYFLEDLSTGKTDFCSSLLVNALLAKACVNTLSYQFMAEARRLWELEDEVPKLTTIQAGCLLHAAMNLNGHDKFGRSYTKQSVKMAQQMGLFHEHQSGNRKLRNAKAYTAWGLAYLPPYPLPDVAQNPGFYGEIWLRYPLDQQLYPMGFGHNMKAFCGLRIILNDICAMGFSLSTEPIRVSWSHALQLQSRLETCCEYYSILILLFDSQLSIPDDIVSPLTSAQRDTAEETIAQAAIQLESLLRIYYLRHSFESYGLLMIFLTHLGNITITHIQQLNEGTLPSQPQPQFPLHLHTRNETLEALRSTIILCLKGLYDQSRNFYVSGIVFDVMKNRLSANEKELVGRYVTLKDAEAEEVAAVDRSQRVISEYVIPIVGLNGDPEEGKLANLVKKFGDMGVEE